LERALRNLGLNQQSKSGIDDRQLEDLIIALAIDDDLCLVQEDSQRRQPQIICSLGLFKDGSNATP
jgi:hypothetical protein